MSAPESDKNIQVNKPTTFPIDLAPQKVTAMVKPQDVKGGTVQTQQTFRTIGQPQQMRMITVPAGTVQSSGGTQIIQTHLMPQMLKQVDSGRTQITALPARTITQTSISVSRPQTPTTFIQRGTTMAGPRGNMSTPIRAQTPPTGTNITASFVRGSIPPRTPSPAGINQASATAWMSGTGAVQVQVPAQLIRTTNINQVNRAPRIVAQTTPVSINSSGTATISANIVTQGHPHNQQNLQQNSQAFVATLATVLPSRPQATLVYSNVANPQQYVSQGQRLTVATSGGQRQVRPIQIQNARLPTTAMGVRVSTSNISNISIRAPNNVPVLTPTNVLTSNPNSMQSRGTGTVTSTGDRCLPTNISNARIIQVQQPSGGFGTQRIAGNLMTLHPVIMNTSATQNRGNPTTITAKVQPSLTITHVGKLAQAGVNTSSATNLSHGTTISSSATITSQPGLINATAVSSSGHQSQNQQITQIVSGLQGHQIVTVSQQQLLNAQNQSGGNQTVVPLAITSRTSNILTGTLSQTIPSTAMIRSGTNVQTSSATILPIAKVLPQQQTNSEIQLQQNQSTIQSQQPTNVLIHTRPGNSGNTTVIPNSGSFLPTSGTFYYEHTSSSSTGNPVLTLTTSSVNNLTNSSNQIHNTTNNISTSGLLSSVAFTPSSGSFAVVPANNRGISQIHGLVPTSNTGQTGQIQAVPVRFNPQLIVDNSQNHQGTTHQIITMSQPGSNVVQNITSINTGQQHLQSQQQQHHQHQHQPQLLQQQQQQQHQPQQQTHMLIPVSAKQLTPSPRPSILRKRDIEGIPIKVAKNLNPTLMAMGPLIVEHRENKERCEPSPMHSPSDGSTTVSATSSPGIDEQEHEQMSSSINLRLSSNMQFKPVGDLFSVERERERERDAENNSTLPSERHIQHQTSSSSNDNGEVSPRKKPRKQQIGNDNNDSNNHFNNEEVLFPNSTENGKPNSSSVNNKENAQPIIETTIKKPRGSLLDSYKQNWKPANNHFTRYTDVKPREERRPTVMDLANQAQVSAKCNGWKVYHLSAQMQDLCELESQVHDRLSIMLHNMESHEISSDVERVNELLKGNMQRSKITVDGISEARTQIMKIFDHKPHVASIIHRCASKRNFKKREKI